MHADLSYQVLFVSKDPTEHNSTFMVNIDKKNQKQLLADRSV